MRACRREPPHPISVTVRPGSVWLAAVSNLREAVSGIGSVRKIIDASREAAARGGLSLPRQLFEMTTLKLTRNLGPNYYHSGRFWRRDMPFRDKWRHANNREYEKLLFAINPALYQKASQHKVLEKATLTLFGIPTPRFIGFFHSSRGAAADQGGLCTLADLRRVLLPYRGQRTCFKAVEGYGGRSFAALEVDAGGGHLQHPVSGRRWTLDAWHGALLESREGWLLEEFLPQHPVLADINPSSVNTLRIWVLEQRGEFQAHHALLRVGRAGSQVDNTSSGGFACPVEIDSGRLLAAPNLVDPHHPITRHPDNGFALVGCQLPFWQESLALGCKALSVFPKMRFAGLDVAITPTGPCMIELNVFPDRISALRWDLPLKDFFEPALQTSGEAEIA